MIEDSICVEVKKQQGQSAIKLLKKIYLINKSLKIQNKQETLYIPLIHQPTESQLKILNKSLFGFKLSKASFSQKQNKLKKINELLEDKIPAHLLKLLPQSMDIVGDIAIIDIPLDLKKYDTILGKAILEINKNVKTVLSKSSPVKGVYRLRNLEFISGKNHTKTIHSEFGCKYHIDVAKAYFSPRLSQEHNRVSSLVKGKEVIIDLFAGVGPFSILIAKNNPEVQMFAIDINPDAIEFLEKNIRLNRVDKIIVPLTGNARNLIDKQLVGSADRVIMNLPENAKEFIDVACKSVKPNGGIIHYYEFIRYPDSIENAQLRFSKRVKDAGRTVDCFLFAKNIRETAPYQHQVAFDVIIH